MFCLSLADRTQRPRHLSNDKEGMYSEQVSVHSIMWHLLRWRNSTFKTEPSVIEGKRLLWLEKLWRRFIAWFDNYFLTLQVSDMLGTIVKKCTSVYRNTKWSKYQERLLLDAINDRRMTEEEVLKFLVQEPIWKAPTWTSKGPERKSEGTDIIHLMKTIWLLNTAHRQWSLVSELLAMTGRH